MSSTGNEWADQGWDKLPDQGDSWKIGDSLGKIVRLRMKALKTVQVRNEDTDLIEADVEVVEADGFTTYPDSAIWGKWFIQTFGEHLPYTALGVVEEVKTDNGFTMRQLRPLTDEERQLADKALDVPGF